jgi:Ca2+-binding EF-hand superfamily protein
MGGSFAKQPNFQDNPTEAMEAAHQMVNQMSKDQCEEIVVALNKRIEQIKCKEIAECKEIAAGHEQAIKNLFDFLDKDKNNKLDIDELKNVVESFTETKFESKQWFAWFDVNGTSDNFIDLDEFTWYLADVALHIGDGTTADAQSVIGSIVEMFLTLAKADEARLSEQLKEIAAGHEQAIKNLFDSLDKDKNNKLDVDELKNVVESFTETKFESKRWFAWFDVNGTSDNFIDLDEFTWYLADVSLNIGDGTTADAKSLIGSIIDNFSALAKEAKEAKAK